MGVDYNSKNQRVGTKRGGGKSANSLTGVAKKADRGREPGAYTRSHQWVAKGGGVPSVSTIQHSDKKGFQTTKVSRPANTAYGKHATVTRGGGVTSIKNVHGNTDVQPEC